MIYDLRTMGQGAGDERVLSFDRFVLNHGTRMR